MSFNRSGKRAAQASDQLPLRQLRKPIGELGVEPEADHKLLDPVTAVAVALCIRRAAPELADQVTRAQGAVAGPLLTVRFGSTADIGTCRGGIARSQSDPGCVKTLRLE